MIPANKIIAPTRYKQGKAKSSSIITNLSNFIHTTHKQRLLLVHVNTFLNFLKSLINWAKNKDERTRIRENKKTRSEIGDPRSDKQHEKTRVREGPRGRESEKVENRDQRSEIGDQG